jgi:hypothetical protein
MPRSLFAQLEELLPVNPNDPDPLTGIEQFAYSRQENSLVVRLEGTFNLQQIEALAKVMREYEDER